MTLPTDYKARKEIPLYDFLVKYFPDAMVELVKVSVAGNKQHGGDAEKISWMRGKSTDQLNTAMRHIFDHGAGNMHDEDGTMHLAKAAWRLLAEIQLIVEQNQTKMQSPSKPRVPGPFMREPISVLALMRNLDAVEYICAAEGCPGHQVGYGSVCPLDTPRSANFVLGRDYGVRLKDIG